VAACDGCTLAGLFGAAADGVRAPAATWTRKLLAVHHAVVHECVKTRLLALAQAVRLIARCLLCLLQIVGTWYPATAGVIAACGGTLLQKCWQHRGHKFVVMEQSLRARLAGVCYNPPHCGLPCNGYPSHCILEASAPGEEAKIDYPCMICTAALITPPTFVTVTFFECRGRGQLSISSRSTAPFSCISNEVELLKIQIVPCQLR
jgi:hypothetical protein